MLVVDGERWSAGERTDRQADDKRLSSPFQMIAASKYIVLFRRASNDELIDIITDKPSDSI